MSPRRSRTVLSNSVRVRRRAPLTSTAALGVAIGEPSANLSAVRLELPLQPTRARAINHPAVLLIRIQKPPPEAFASCVPSWISWEIQGFVENRANLFWGGSASLWGLPSTGADSHVASGELGFTYLNSWDNRFALVLLAAKR